MSERLSRTLFTSRRILPPSKPHTNQIATLVTRTSPRKRCRPYSLDLPTLPRPAPRPTTNNFFFKGSYPKFIREVDHAGRSKMWVICGTPESNTFKRRNTHKKIDGTNLYETHYLTHHKSMPSSAAKENDLFSTLIQAVLQINQRVNTGRLTARNYSRLLSRITSLFNCRAG
jgi:hypothetical protein